MHENSVFQIFLTRSKSEMYSVKKKKKKTFIFNHVD